MRNYSIDTLKTICAILIIFIHTPKTEIMQECVAPFFRCAVPLFFMISGYFTYGKSNLNNVIRKRIIGQLKILGWGMALYFIISVITNGTTTIDKMHHFLTPSFFLFNTVPYAGHLWYIIAYIYVLVFMLIVEKYNLYTPLFITTPFLLLGTLVTGTYSGILLNNSLPFHFSRNFFFTGIPFFTLGMIIKHYKQTPTIPFLTIATIAFYIIGLVEVSFIGVFAGDCYFSTIFLSVFIFLLFINIKQPNDTVFSRLGREDSLYIYVLHFFIADIVRKYTTTFPSLQYISTPLVLCLTLLLIILLRKTKIIGKII